MDNLNTPPRASLRSIHSPRLQASMTPNPLSTGFLQFGNTFDSGTLWASPTNRSLGSRRHDLSGMREPQFSSVFDPSSMSPMNNDAKLPYGSDKSLQWTQTKFHDFLNLHVQKNVLRELENTQPQKYKGTPYYIAKLYSMWEKMAFIDTDARQDSMGLILRFPIDATDIQNFCPELYRVLIHSPLEIVPIFDSVAYQTLLQYLMDKHGEQSMVNVLVYITHLAPEECKRMRDLNPVDIEHLISMKGIVIRVSDLLPNMSEAFYQCTSGNCEGNEVVLLAHHKIVEPVRCPICNAMNVMQLVHEECAFSNKQLVKIQELPDDMPEGETPQAIQAYLFDDMFDSLRPGDRCEIVGVYRAAGVRVHPTWSNIKVDYRTFVDVVSASVQSEDSRNQSGVGADTCDTVIPLDNTYDLDIEVVGPDEAAMNADIRMEAQKVDSEGYRTITKKLIDSLAPSIYENEHVKKGLLVQLFGGSRKDYTKFGRGKVRGEVHVLLVGDPGTAKSQLMQYTHKISPRGVITGGKGSSSVGLTAYVSKDPDTKDFVLESGALVLSDRGICCIDEFDKMDDNTRAVLMEAMEQQTVSVAKAGIVCSLNARTAIFATANPIHSRYDHNKTLMDNVHLAPSLTSRFDLLYLMLDKQDETTDQRLAAHLVNMFSEKDKCDESEGASSGPPFSREFLRKYIVFARKRCKPCMTEEAQKAVKDGWLLLRKQSIKGNLTASVKTIECVSRIAEAFAKMELRSDVLKSDIDEAFRLLREATYEAVTDPTTGKIDMGMLTHGTSMRERESMDVARNFVLEILTDPLPIAKAREMVNDKLRQDGLRINFQHLNEVFDGLVQEGLIRRQADGTLCKI